MSGKAKQRKKKNLPALNGQEGETASELEQDFPRPWYHVGEGVFGIELSYSGSELYKE